MIEQQSIEGDVPRIPLYHYTSVGALLGIARSKVLWASSPYYLNDSAEVIYAASVLDKLIDERIRKNEESEVSLRVLNELKGHTRFLRNPNLNVFTFSLSEKESLLSQWRSYTEHGKGVSLEFQPELITKILSLSKLRIARCLYSERDQISHLNRLLDTIVLAVGNKISEIVDSTGKMPHPIFQFLGTTYLDVLQALCIVKHPSFEEEQEWRLMAVTGFDERGETVCFREGSSMLIPYIELHLPEDRPLLSKVILGPSQHSDLSMYALSRLIVDTGLCNSLRNSLIPYREWSH